MDRANSYACRFFLLASWIGVAGCDDSVTDFGFTGSISGTITDPSGQIVSGNTATVDFQVMVLGEGETQPLELPVKGDGTYANTHLYPQEYHVWIEGPVISDATVDDPVAVDLTAAAVTHDFTVVPYLTIPPPTAGEPSAEGIAEVSYDIRPADGFAAQTGLSRVVWASTASWPGPTTGNVADRTHTVTEALPSNSGEVTVSGLRPGETYYIRVGAVAVGTTLWNMSEQVSISVPE